MSTDFRSLCAELNHWVVELAASHPNLSDSVITWINEVADRARAELAKPEPVAPELVYRYSPVTVAECNGPCEQGPQSCDCGQIKGEPAPEPVAPTDEEIVELMPQQMRDDLANAARALAGFDRNLLDRVEPKDLTQIALQMLFTIERMELIIPEITDTIRKALEQARPTIQPVPVSERLPGPEDCDAKGMCWMLYRSTSMNRTATWSFAHRCCILDAPYTHSLPHHALPTPEATNQEGSDRG
jgi:hypothetical protein